MRHVKVFNIQNSLPSSQMDSSDNPNDKSSKTIEFQRRAIIIDKIHPTFKGKLNIVNELARSAPDHLVRQVKCLDRGGVLVVFDKPDSADLAVNSEILKEAFGGQAKISRTSKFRTLFPSCNPPPKTNADDDLKIVTFDFPPEVTPDEGTMWVLGKITLKKPGEATVKAIQCSS